MFASGHFREGQNVVLEAKKRTVMLECDPSAHVIRFHFFLHRWQATRKYAIFLCSCFVLRSSKFVLVFGMNEMFFLFFFGCLVFNNLILFGLVID